MSRVDTLKELLQKEGYHACALVPGANFLYLTGLSMTVSKRVTLAVVPLEGEPFVVCPVLEEEKIRRVTGWQNTYAWRDEEGPWDAAKRAFEGRDMEGKTIACEFMGMRLVERQMLLDALAGTISIANADPILEGMRASKDDDELACMEKAVICVEAAMAAAQKVIKPGVRESDIAKLISETIGANGGAGGGSVICGERGCMPHAITSDRPMESGEMVIIDMVARYQGYAADITRTFAVGEPSEELRKIYEIVKAAQAYGRANAKPGMTGEEIDALCRGQITAAGYGEYFIHRTGHGLGLEVHEAPYVVKGNHRPFAVGTTFTIEPGIYIPGVGGVRIEDDVVLEEEGARSLTSYPRDLFVLV